MGTPNSNLEKQPWRRVTTGTAPPWAGPPSSASATGRGSEWSLGKRGRRRFGSTPWGGMGSASRPAAEARVQSSAWGRATTCGSNHRAVCGTGAGGLDRAPLDHCGEGSWRRRPSAAAERGRTDICWPLVIKAGKLPGAPGAFSRPCSLLPKAPSPI